MTTESRTYREKNSLQATATGHRPRRGTTLLRLLFCVPGILLLALLSFGRANAGVADNTFISNQARVTYQDSGQLQSNKSNIDVLKANPAGPPPTIGFFRFAGGAQPDITISLQSAAFSPDGTGSGNFTKLPPPVEPGSPPLDLNKLKLRQTDLFHGGDPVFILVTDVEHNVRPGLAETIIVEITSSTGDKEVLQLIETGEDTGIFAGFMQTSAAVPGTTPGYDGKLSVTSSSRIIARYIDSWDRNEVVTAAALVDPTGVVFDSVTGQPVNGATITLVDESTGKGASVTGDDGVSIFPSTVTSGSTASDTEKKLYHFAPGGYRFPLIKPGTYRLAVTPPAGYRAPSIVSEAILQKLPGAPFFLSPSSRGEVFVVNPGPIIHIDIPLDPVPKGFWVEKTAGKATAGIGDFVPFRIKVTNLDPDHPATGVVLTDILPHGMRFQAGSLRLDGKKSGDPAILADGTTLHMPLGAIGKAGKVEVSYVAQIVPGAQVGSTITNWAYIESGNEGSSGANPKAAAAPAERLASNKASASVIITEDFLTSRSFIMGTLAEGFCGREGTGLEGVRVYLENGTFVISDRKGMFHFEGVTPGTHVVQLDLDSLPEGYTVIPCEENTRFAGRSYSQFVDLQGGTVWRVDFRVGKVERKERAPEAPPLRASSPIPDSPLVPDQASSPSEGDVTEEGEESTPDLMVPAKGEVRVELTSNLDNETINYRTGIWGGGVPLSNVRLLVTLPAGVHYQAGSSSVDGTPIPDPQIDGSILSYPLGSFPEEWTRQVRFRADIAPTCKAAELVTRAIVAVDTATQAGQTTPIAENRLDRLVEEQLETMPELILYPTFPTFGARLADQDKKMLDDIAARLSGLQIESITVTGHTDNIPIARRSRSKYPDNTSLSLARASTVGRYLMDKLTLPPSALELFGKGESQPITTNRNKQGRALNRRVEIIVRSFRRLEQTRNELVKKESGILKREVTGLSATPPAKMGAGPSLPVPQPVPGSSLLLSGSDYPDPGDELADSAAHHVLPAVQTVAAAPGSPAPGAVSEETGKREDIVAVPAQDAPAGSGASTQEDEELPLFDMAWIENVQPGREWVWPPPVYYPAIPSTHLALKHDPGDKVALSVNGEEVPAVLLEKVLKHPAGTVSVSYWRGVPLREGDNKVVAVLHPMNGSEQVTLTREMHVSTSPVRGEVVPELCTVVANGKTPPVVAIRLFDKDDYPIRQGMTGRYRVNPPHQPFVDPEKTRNNDLMTQEETRYVAGKEGVILIPLQPTNKTGEAMVTIPVGDNREEQYRVWLTPERREWILVGLAEGTAGYNTVAGHMENLHSAGGDDNYYDNGRIAFFAKGTVQGKWLLTLSYDTAKKRPATDENLFQAIDPNKFYTLYGDATQQQYDAASIRKLYLKIERDQFYALFGDYNTGLTVTELSRYSRSLNGLKTEYQGKFIEVNAFASETGQSFSREEIRGDGTSGLYHLSRKNILINSEKISIVIRDRFRSEVTVSARSLTRYMDYSIDYNDGTIFFKEPIPSKDLNLNPTYIVVEYETLDVGSESLNFGGRGGVKMMDGKVRAGTTYIHEKQLSGQGNLYGVDAAWQIGTGTVLKGEVASTESDTTGIARDGLGYLAELEHRDRKLESRLYFRQQDVGFGLGQQSAGEVGTRKFGLDAAYKINDAMTLSNTGYRQYTLSTGGIRDVVEGKASYTFLDYATRFGLRYAGDTLPDGTAKTSEQVTMGATWLTLKKKLSLHVDHDQSIGGNSNIDFPTRTTVGADYKITDSTTIMGQQEFTHGEGVSTEGTRIGIRSNPWDGGAINTAMEQQITENGSRLFALFGIKQTWKLSKEWGVDVGLDRTSTLRKSGSYTLNDKVPPASGGEDFTAVSLGTSYVEKKWNWSSRVEYRTSDSEEKWGVLSSFVGEPAEGWGWSARLQFFDSESPALSKLNSELRLGLVHRPFATKVILLDRLDLLFDQQDGASIDLNSRRIVNNFSINFKPHDRLQAVVFYGAKYVFERIDGADYSGYVDNPGTEIRYDISKKFDIGIRGSLLHTWRNGEKSYSTGPSIGYNIMQNAWLSVGYNVIGFADRDFSRSDYTAQGPYVKFRFKFDQNTIKEAITLFSIQ